MYLQCICLLTFVHFLFPLGKPPVSEVNTEQYNLKNDEKTDVKIEDKNENNNEITKKESKNDFKMVLHHMATAALCVESYYCGYLKIGHSHTYMSTSIYLRHITSFFYNLTLATTFRELICLCICVYVYEHAPLCVPRIHSFTHGFTCA